MRTPRLILSRVAGDDAKLERLTDLILVLLNTPLPIPLSRIAHEVPGYPDSHEARRQAFERDKVLLREEGIVVEAVAIDGPDQFGYRIDPEKFFLPDLDLTDAEQVALTLAVAGVQMDDESGGDALRKLGVVDFAEVSPIAMLGASGGLDRLFQAISSQAETRFSYRGEPRVVSPLKLRFAEGHWYLVGWSKERGAQRNFRVDRIDGAIRVGTPGSADRSSVDSKMDDGAWAAPSPDSDDDRAEPILVRVDPLYAWKVAREVGEDRVVERQRDGSVLLSVPVSQNDLARSWVLSFLEHVEVLEPPAFREELVGWLTEVRDAPEPVGVVPRVDDLLGSMAQEHGSATAVPPAQQRLRRLLAMLTWLASEGSVRTEDVAARFSMTEQEVIRELELAACCGRPPYSPGELMDIVVDSECVEARLPELKRQRHLTPAEGVALAAASRTILAMPGADSTGALARALGKLEAALGDRAVVHVDIPSPPWLEMIAQAANEQRELTVEYLASSTDELTKRVIDPLRVTALDGRWYVEAYCHRASDRRTFRVDQFKSVIDTGAQPRDLDRTLGGIHSFTPTPESTVAIVSLTQSARWIADSVRVLARRFEPDGGAVVALSVSGRRWFERILLQAGPGAAVLAPGELGVWVREAANRVLERYQPTV